MICIHCNKDAASKNRTDKKYHCKNKECNAIFSEEEVASFNEEKRKELNLNRSLEELQRSQKYLINTTPTRTFEIGEIIDIKANWYTVKVVDKIDNLFYKLEYSVQEKNGTMVVNHTWKLWKDLFKKDDNRKNQEILNKRRESILSRMRFSQSPMCDLLSKYYYFGIDMNPTYQRDLVWELEDKVLLIDSIFRGADIGKFVFIHNEYSDDVPCYEILDGKQRLSAIIDFVEDRFSYKGKFYSEMHPMDQSEFFNFCVNIAETQSLSESDKYRYFLELNTRGRPQSEEHINKVKTMLETALLVSKK